MYSLSNVYGNILLPNLKAYVYNVCTVSINIEHFQAEGNKFVQFIMACNLYLSQFHVYCKQFVSVYWHFDFRHDAGHAWPTIRNNSAAATRPTPLTPSLMPIVAAADFTTSRTIEMEELYEHNYKNDLLYHVGTHFN